MIQLILFEMHCCITYLYFLQLNDLLFLKKKMKYVHLIYLPINLYFCILLFMLYVLNCSPSIHLAYSHNEGVFHVDGGKIL